MAEITGERVVRIELDKHDLRQVEDDGLNIECPLTGDTIYFGYDDPTCECCGQRIDTDITPSVRGMADRLRNGGTVFYTTVHNEDDITLVVRGTREVTGGVGWK